MSSIIFIVTYFSLFFISLPEDTEIKYPVSEIPVELLKGANAVIRDHSHSFTVNAIDHATTHHHIAITILNENGKSFNSEHVFYDNDSKVHYFRAYLYNAKGELVKKLKRSEIRDQSAISNISIYEDDRVKIAELNSNRYPYTVEFEYEVSGKGTLFYPTWEPVSTYYVALQKSDFKVTMPPGLKLRYKEQNIAQPVKKSSFEGLDQYKWELKNISPIKTEFLGPKFSQVTPKVYTAPSKFSTGGYEGDLSSWENLGQWVNKLNSGRDDLPESIKEKIKEITAGATSDRQKVKMVYQYLQENTRYVSIQLGIGGWQPFKASYVAEKGYGDCKALTNYTMAMLNSLDIKSYYTLVKAGEKATDIHADFPNARFNHAFLCVPLGADTIWLECTSQTNPFGYLGSFTGDRKVLVVTEDGGKIVHTPVYTQKDNRQITNADIHLDKDGNAKVEANIVYTGLQFENNYLNYYLHQGYDQQKKWLYSHLGVSGAKIDKFNLTASGDFVPEGKKALSLTVPKYASVNGKRIFLQPNMLNRMDNYVEQVENRKSEVHLKTASMDFDTVTYYLPEGYHVEFKPDAIKYESPFGVFVSETKVEEGKITFMRSLKINKGVYPPESYEELRGFIKKIVKSDQAKIVFVSAT